MKSSYFKIILALVALALIGAFFAYDLGQYLTLEFLKSKQTEFTQYYAQNQFSVILGFFIIYVVFIALSLPAASIFTLLGGAIFGFSTGLLIVSFASSVGAFLAFLFARYLFGSYVQEKYADTLKKIYDGFKKEGNFYLFALRLVPLFPFFAVNILMAVVPIKPWSFYWVSQLGMLPGTAVFVYAGTQLATIDSLSSIASPQLLLAFALLGLFPILSKKILGFIKKRSVK